MPPENIIKGILSCLSGVCVLFFGIRQYRRMPNLFGDLVQEGEQLGIDAPDEVKRKARLASCTDFWTLLFTLMVSVVLIGVGVLYFIR